MPHLQIIYARCSHEIAAVIWAFRVNFYIIDSISYCDTARCRIVNFMAVCSDWDHSVWFEHTMYNASSWGHLSSLLPDCMEIGTILMGHFGVIFSFYTVLCVTFIGLVWNGQTELPDQFQNRVFLTSWPSWCHLFTDETMIHYWARFSVILPYHFGGIISTFCRSWGHLNPDNTAIYSCGRFRLNFQYHVMTWHKTTFWNTGDHLFAAKRVVYNSGWSVLIST